MSNTTSSSDSTSAQKTKVINNHEYIESRIFGALTVIIIGIIFLLNSTGVLSWSIWLNILRFWPLFIVTIGISMIFTGSRLLNFVGLLINFAIFLSVLIFVAGIPLVVNRPISFFGVHLAPQSQTLQTEHIILADDYQNIEHKNFDFNIPLGEITINDDETDNFLRFESLNLRTRDSLTFTESVEDSTLAVNLNTEGRQALMFSNRSPQYLIRLGQIAIPLDLNMQFGAGKANVNFDNQIINNLNMQVGAGSLELELSKESLPADSFDLRAGVGSIRLVLPDDVGIRINYNVGIGSIKVNNNTIASGISDGVYTSDNFDSAEKTIVINAHAGVGSIELITR